MDVTKFREFCSSNNILYYARPKEDFSVYEAYGNAFEDDYDYLLMEDLS